MQLKKILIIRFSSIGDIVLTTPIIRCAKKQLSSTEIHFVTKEAFKSVLVHNPNISKLYTFKEDISELYEQLKAEKYDVLIDLHKNLRSLRLKQKLKVKSFSFNKLNVEKFLAVRFKQINKLPAKHIVDRYFETIKPLGVKNDSKGLDYFIHSNDEVDTTILLLKQSQKKFIALVVGGSYYTKKIPLNKLVQICQSAPLPVILLGGKEDKLIADELQKQIPQLINTCGQYSINQSASIIKQAEWVITSDTGLMHIASAYNKKIISIWGNTIPEFGMAPYLPNIENTIIELKGLSCRPCSKLGFKACPKGHFKCMNEIDLSVIKELK
ncbi:MAG: glycosyltransferase family 9 protein [Bacteroidetes bacterium]|nr:glycosyltransferase family 9 protein [Bacteroidota bacterium]